MNTLICFVLDRSGSMAGHESDTVGGVNAFIEKQKKEPGEASIVIYRFDTGNIERIRPLGALGLCAPLQSHEVEGRGGTPLLDAIGSATDYCMAVSRGEVEGGKFDRYIVIIVTDGHENDSRTFTKAHIKERIKSLQDSGVWSFIYLGADVDAFDEAQNLGIWTSNAAGVTKSARGFDYAYAQMSESVSHTRMTGSTVATNLAKDLGESKESEKDWKKGT